LILQAEKFLARRSVVDVLKEVMEGERSGPLSSSERKSSICFLIDIIDLLQ